MKVADVMTRNPITVTRSHTLNEVVRLLAEHRISGLPVVSRNRLVGVITQTDIIRAIDVYEKINKGADAFEMIIGLLESKDKKVKTSVRRMLSRKVMHLKGRKVISVEADEDLYKSAALINTHQIDRLPVTQNGRLVGIITKTDIIMALEKWKVD